MIDQKVHNQYYHALTSTTDSSIAQPVEQRTVNPCVPGSSPGRGAKQLKKPCRNVGLFYFRDSNRNKTYNLNFFYKHA